jgi:hypothetical protein
MSNTIAFDKAVALLQKSSTSAGFTAAGAAAEDNYCRVWTRDSVVCGLAALLTGDTILIETFKKSLITIWEHQHPTGFLPSNVDVNNKVSYGGTVGRADTPSWGIIGLCMYAKHTKDSTLLKTYEPQLKLALKVMDAWEFNGKHLIYVPQSGDWADEYLQHGYILFDQLLRLWALQLAADSFQNKTYVDKAALIKETIENNFFNRQDDDHWYAGNMIHQKKDAPKSFWWMGFNPAQIYPQYDLQANALAILLNIGTDEQQKSCIAYTQKLLVERGTMLPSFWPPVQFEDREMEELKNNFAYRFRNKPGEFHNAGLWPVWNGLMCAALKLSGYEDLQKNLLSNMIDAVSKNGYEMNECYNAETNNACGVNECAWSGAGIIFSERAYQLFS